MSEIVAADTVETSQGVEVAERKGFSGTPVNVRLGVTLGSVALVLAFGLLDVVVSDKHLWYGALLAVGALGLSGYAAYLGIFGVIRYGLFTEGCGAGEVADELHLSKIAWIAGVLAEIAMLFTAALAVALVVRALT
jgi:hypothetical protein